MARKKEDLPLGKRFSIWFRKNERYVWIILLVIITVSFGATFTIGRVLSDTGRYTYFKVGGTSYSIRDTGRFLNWFRNISYYAPQLNFRGLVSGYPYERLKEEADIRRDVLAPILAADTEARELGIEIPPERIIKIAKQCYLEAARKQAVWKATELMTPQQREKFKKSKEAEEIRNSVTWSPAKYRAWVEKRGYTVRDFETALEILLRVQALRELFLSGDLLSRKDLYETFLKQKRKLSLAIAVVDADRFKDQVKKEYTEEELKSYYDTHQEEFSLPDRVRFSYLKFRLADMDKRIKISEAEIHRYYTKERRRFLVNPAVPPPEPTYPLTPREAKEVKAEEDRAFKPLEEVRDEITAELKKQKMRTEAMKLARELRKELGLGGPQGEKKESTAKPEDLVSKYGFLEYGTTPWFTRDDAEKKLGELHYGSVVDGWFEDLKNGKPLRTPPSYLTTAPKKKENGVDKYVEEERIYFLVLDVKGEKAKTLAWDIDGEECRSVAEEKLTEQAALEKAREAARNLITLVNQGKKLKEVAGEIPVHITEPISRMDWNKIEIDGEKLPPMIQAQIFIKFFRELDVSKTVIPTPLEDTENARFLVCAVNEVVETPDTSEFDEETEKQLRQSLSMQLRRERALVDWKRYLQELVNKYVEFKISSGRPQA